MSYLRRSVGVVIGGTPAGVLVASLVDAVVYGDHDRGGGLAVICGALLIAGLNVYLSVGRPLLHRRANGSMDGYKRTSGIPMLGSLAVVIGGLLGFGSALCAALGLVAVALDTGGTVWLLVATWRDTSLWDG